MKGNQIVKLLAIIVILFGLWKYGVPWLKQHQTSGSSSSSGETTSPATNCLFEARAANDYWGSGIGQFSGAIDKDRWASFKSGVDDRIRSAERKCSCNDTPCTNAKQAMAELRALANEWDGAATSGGAPPSDTVQRQESINNALQ